jgi:hypothetical protein
MRIETHEARLLPSSRGWFFASRTNSTAALSTKSGEEVKVAEPRRWRVQCGVREVEVGHLRDCDDIESGDVGCDREVVGEVEVLDGHFARRSRSSRSCSMI